MFYFIFIILLFVPDFASASACQSLKNSEDVIQCSLEKHPRIQRAQKELEQGVEQESLARQIPNPEIGSSGVTGNSLGDRIVEAEISVSQPLELWGKRSSRIEKAQAEVKKTEAFFLAAKQETYLETVLTLNRLRQIVTELEILDEALVTFGRITGQFRSRPRLNPDQQVSLGIIQLAHGDYKIRRSALAIEEFETRKKLNVWIAQELPASKEILPVPRETWPGVINVGFSVFKDAATSLSQAEALHAQAEYEAAKSESWPDLKIGPVFQYKSEGGISYQTYGVNISFPLPIFNQNGGGRAFALKGVFKAENDLALINQEKQAEYSILKEKYERGTTVLRETLSVREIEGKHKNIERLFSQGLIAGTSVVEAHRQILDYTKSKHEQELSSLEALIKIRALQGTLFEEKL